MNQGFLWILGMHGSIYEREAEKYFGRSLKVHKSLGNVFQEAFYQIELVLEFDQAGREQGLKFFWQRSLSYIVKHLPT